MNLAQQFERAEQYFFNGNLQECADLCKQMLDANPDFAHGYYLMGALFKTTGNFQKAVSLTDVAIKLAPNVAAFHLQRGHSAFILGEIDEAGKSFERTLEIDPASVVAALLLGDVYAKQSRFDKAIAMFKKAKSIQDIPEIDEHHGLCLHMKGDMEGAAALLKQVIATRPDYDWGYVHLGKVQLDMGKSQEATANFEKALQLNNDAYEAWLCLAQIHKAEGNTDRAMAATKEVLRSNPGLSNGHMLMGELAALSGDPAQSESCYRTALGLEPGNINAMQGLALALVNLRRVDEAKSYLDQVYSQRPDDVSVRYLRAALSGEAIDTAPKEYVAQLFDNYAERFDQHLQQKLSYNTPQLLADRVKHVVSHGQIKTPLSLLDLGCGTGLGAEALADITTARVGVDLSSKMLIKARAKGLYDALEVEDVVEYADQTSQRFDLVAAVDVLVYIGDLTPLFSAVHKALKQNGLFAFSVEKSEAGEDFILRNTARYAHGEDYIRSVSERLGFVLADIFPTILREEMGKPMHGFIVVLKKPAVT